MELTGILFEILPEKTISEKFSIKEFVLQVDSGNYTEYILFQLSNQNIKLLDSFMLNEMITVYFNIGGRKSKDRYWNSLKAFKIEVSGKADILPVIEERESRNVHKNADCNSDFNTKDHTEENFPSLPSSEVDNLPF